MPVRKVVTRRSNHTRGYHPSRKNGCSFGWESQLEAGFLRLLELSPSVLTYEVQPSLEVVSMNGVSIKYIPDVCVNFADGITRWFEIKPSIRLLNQKIEIKIRAIKTHFENNGRAFFIATEELIQKSPMTDNLLILMYHRRGPDISALYNKEIQCKFEHYSPRNVNDLIQILGPQEAWRLLGLGYVGINLQESICETTPIY